jgi:gliding motility-associated-like protein
MKKLAIISAFLSLVFTQELKATHFAGAEIFYEHVPGTARDYCVTLIVYGDLNGTASLPIDADITYSSSCFGATTVTNVLNLQGAQINYNRNNYIYTQAYPCAPYDPNDPNSVQFYSFSYQTCITLPGDCQDWVFAWTDFARNNAIDNIVNPGSEDLYIEAKLNNNLGQNSSPRFTSAPVKQFCVKQQNDPPFPLVQNAVEADGDSVHYKLAQPLNGPNSPIPWANGYNTANPISSWTTPTIDQATSTFFFTPNNPEVDVLKIVVEEFRFNGIQWIFVGSTERDLQIPILSGCNSVAEKGPAINTSLPGFTASTMSSSLLEGTYGISNISNDSVLDPTTNEYIYDVPVIEYSCFDDSITLTFNPEPLIYTPSISEAEDEFRIIGPDGEARPIVDISFTPDPGSPVQTNQIHLKLHKPLDEDGIYVVHIKNGSDGNTLMDECGFQLPPNQIMLIEVKDCPDLNYSLDLVTVEDDRNRRVKWSIDDPNYLRPDLFNYWRLGMKVGGNSYSIEINDINAREYLDETEFFENQVDFQNFEYSIQLVQNADFKAPAAEQLTTIKLVNQLVPQAGEQKSILELAWNAYNGWDSAFATYQLFVGSVDPNNTMNISWEIYQNNNTNYFFNNYEIDASTPANDGLYAIKVEATDANNPPPAGEISESNWIYFEIKHEVIPDLTLVTPFTPNVFTPNNDNKNDRFFIDGANGSRMYSEIQLSVYNRWGQLVYEDPNFGYRNSSQQGWDGTDIYTGKRVSDGVYYYVATLSDPLTETKKELQGSVTILGQSGSN